MYICIDSICFDVSRIGVAGAKIAGLEELINHKQVFSYNSDDNLCLFAALVYHYDPQFARQNVDKVRPRAKKYYKDYYGYNFNLDYKGFNLTEFQKFCNHFKINVTVYCFDRKAKKNKTETQDLYRIQQEYFAEPETEDQLNILLINIGKSFHIMLIKDVEALTGFCCCNICHRIICKKDVHYGDRTFKKHLKLHEQGLVGKKLCKLNSTQKP
jgi:hypothetical protein